MPPSEGSSLPHAPSTANTIVGELKQRGLGGKASRDLIAAHAADYILRKIDYLDFLIETGERPNKPAGWFRAAIDQDYGPPAGYLPRAERLRHQQAAEQNDRRKHEEQTARRRQEAHEAAARKAQRAHIDAYLNTLTPQQRNSLEQQAVAHADDRMRQAALRSDPLAEITRRLLLDQEVLRVHPLPAHDFQEHIVA